MLAVAELLFAMSSSGAGSSAPSLSAVTVDHYSGSCPGSSATVTPRWTVLNPDDANYELHILENGSLLSTQVSSSSSYAKTISGFIEAGPYRQFTSNWTYVVQLVRKSDGVTIASSTSAEWTTLYGACDAFEL